MTRTEIEKRIKDLKEEDFIIGVSSDFLTHEEHARLGEINDEIRRLQKMLEAMDND